MAKSIKPEKEEALEKKLWKAADKLRKNMDAAEYKHVVLGLIFLKYISDAFEELYQQLVAQKDKGADPEDSNEYIAEKVEFWISHQGITVEVTVALQFNQGEWKKRAVYPRLNDAVGQVFFLDFFFVTFFCIKTEKK